LRAKSAVVSRDNVSSARAAGASSARLAPRSRRRYSDQELKELRAVDRSDRGALKRLAERLGRTYGGVRVKLSAMRAVRPYQQTGAGYPGRRKLRKEPA